MHNLVIHITLPAGFRLTNGAILNQPVTFQVVGALNPFYVGIDQVKLIGGVYLNKLAPLTIASMIYTVSKNADSYSYNSVKEPTTAYTPDDSGWKRYMLWLNARQNFVNYTVAATLLLNVYELSGAKGSHTLGNLSVSRQSIMRDEGMPKKLSQLQQDASDWLIALKSGGAVGPAGHIKPQMAAKGIFDPSDSPPGRKWAVTGMGANLESVPGFGSAGKPFKFSSMPFSGFRAGAVFGNYVAIYNPGVSF